jgi:putative flippase GtrA
LKKSIATQYQTFYQFFKFSIVGASGTIITLTSLFILTELTFLEYWQALPIGYFLGIINNFYWNRKYTFAKTNESIITEFIKYTLSMLTGAVAYNLSTILLTEFFGIWYFYSAILSVGISTIIDFVLSKFWVFRTFQIPVLSEPGTELRNLKVKLVISCLNEEKNVEVVISDIFKNIPKSISLYIILINNGSNDLTGDKIESLAKNYDKIVTVQRELPLDYSSSIIDGIKNYYTDLNEDYIGWAPSDNQITGQSISKMLNILVSHDVKYLKALRYEKDYSLSRKIQSFFFNAIISFTYQIEIQDINGSPKFIQKEIFDSLELNYKRWFLDAEAHIKISKLLNKHELINVPIRFNERIHGKSKTSMFTAFELFLQLMNFRFFGIGKWMKNLKNNNPKEQ